jgi:simple sugar transport system permease protein
MELSLVPLLLEAAVRAGTPILLAALGELLAERAGVLNLGVEGMMLVGALTGFIVSQQSGEPWIGVLAAAMAGVMLSCVHAFLSISLHANQVGSGLALAIFGTGLSGLLGKPFVGVPTKGFAPIAVPWLADVPLLGRIFFSRIPDLCGLPPGAGLWVLLYRTRPSQGQGGGRASQERGCVGHQRRAVRYSCVLAGGLAAGLGGAYLSLAYTQMWVDEYDGGPGLDCPGHGDLRRLNPLRTALGFYLFGGVQALQLRLPGDWRHRADLCADDDTNAFTILALIIASTRRPGALRHPSRFGDGHIRASDGNVETCETFFPLEAS